jgi:molybdopterin-synthase adenylyltransferase
LLTPEIKARYARQMLLPEIGALGQEKIGNGSVLIIGLGGLGSPVAYYLAAAGIGQLGLVDSDYVEVSNLHRQILHFNTDLKKSKVKSAIEKISSLNPNVNLQTYDHYVNEKDLSEILPKYDFVIEATDNFSSKYAISDACVLNRKPFCHAGITGFTGQLFSYVPNKQCGCYRCLFPQPPAVHKIPDRAAGAILGTVPGTIGTLQATEAIKYLLDMEGLLLNRLLVYDAKNMSMRSVHFSPSANCPVCRKQ